MGLGFVCTYTDNGYMIHLIHMSPDPAFVTLAHAYNYQAYAVYRVTHPAFYLYEKLAWPRSEKSRSLESANDSKTSEQSVLYEIHTNHEFGTP